MYVFVTDYVVEPGKFVINDEFPKGIHNAVAGCSPDGFVKIPGRGFHPGLVEIKCLGAAKHVLMHAYYQKNGRTEPGYVAQCQGQMLITGRRWVDMFFYNPDLPQLTIRIQRDELFMALLAAQINKVASRRDELLEAMQKEAA